MRPPASSRRRHGVPRKQARVEPKNRHRRRQPAARRTGARPPHGPTPRPAAGNRPRSPAVTASSTARQSPPGDPDGASGRAASRRTTSGTSRVSCSRSIPARAANRDRHDRAVDAGTLRRPPGAAEPRAAPPPGPPRRPALASTSTAMITAAPYRRRDHKSAGSSTCVRPHRRHLPRRGQNHFSPPASRPAAAAHDPTAPARRRTGSAAPRPPAATRHFPQNLVPSPPGATSGTVRAALPEVLPKDITGRAAATAYMATVTPSTSPASRIPPNHPERHRQRRKPHQRLPRGAVPGRAGWPDRHHHLPEQLITQLRLIPATGQARRLRRRDIPRRGLHVHPRPPGRRALTRPGQPRPQDLSHLCHQNLPERHTLPSLPIRNEPEDHSRVVHQLANQVVPSPWQQPSAGGPMLMADDTTRFCGRDEGEQRPRTRSWPSTLTGAPRINHQDQRAGQNPAGAGGGGFWPSPGR